MQKQQLTKQKGFVKEFENKHQLLTWRQYATVEHRWYNILKMDLSKNTLLIEKLETEDPSYNTNGRVFNWVTAAAKAEAASKVRNPRKKIVGMEEVLH